MEYQGNNLLADVHWNGLFGNSTGIFTRDNSENFEYQGNGLFENTQSLSSPNMVSGEIPTRYQKTNENVDHQGQSLSGNAPFYSSPLRLTGGGETYFEYQESINPDNHCNNENNVDREGYAISIPPQRSSIECFSDSVDTLSDISLPFRELESLNSEFEVPSGIEDLDDPGGNLEDIANLDISIGSIPLLEQSPCIIDNVTPNLSLDTTADGSENLYNSGAEGMTSTQGLLLEAGYTSIEIENMSSNSKQNCDEGNYGRSRPQTQVFYQGKTFTCEKWIH